MIEIKVESDSQFLRIRETLTRIGIESRKDGKKIIYQSAHLLYKRQKYYIIHFKELFGLDGRDTTIDETDLKRVNSIAIWLEIWGLTELVDKKPEVFFQDVWQSGLSVVKFQAAKDYDLRVKYKMGMWPQRKANQIQSYNF